MLANTQWVERKALGNRLVETIEQLVGEWAADAKAAPNEARARPAPGPPKKKGGSLADADRRRRCGSCCCCVGGAASAPGRATRGRDRGRLKPEQTGEGRTRPSTGRSSARQEERRRQALAQKEEEEEQKRQAQLKRGRRRKGRQQAKQGTKRRRKRQQAVKDVDPAGQSAGFGFDPADVPATTAR